MLIILTLIYCITCYFLKVNTDIAPFIYLIGFGFLKGISCKELRDVFNFRSMAYMYKTTGLSDSIASFVSLAIIQLYFFVIADTGLTVASESTGFDVPFAIAFAIIFFIIYRFMFWNMATIFRKIYSKS